MTPNDAKGRQIRRPDLSGSSQSGAEECNGRKWTPILRTKQNHKSRAGWRKLNCGQMGRAFYAIYERVLWGLPGCRLAHSTQGLH